MDWQPLWEKSDDMVYEEAVSKYLNTEVDPSSTGLAITYLTNAITRSMHETVPLSKEKPKKALWNPCIANAHRRSVEADAIWKKADKPPPPSSLFFERLNAKKTF